MRASNLKLGLLLGILMSVAIVATNVIWPLLAGNPSPDNELSEGIGWLIVILIVFAAGFFRIRRTSNLRDAAIAGGTITFVAFAMTMLTFLVIDNLFIDIVSRQSEKIWLFQRSGFADMRSYLNHSNLRALWTALPVITAFGAICGLAGGYVGRLVQGHARWNPLQGPHSR